MPAFSMEVEHALKLEAAIAALQKACEYYQQKYVKYVMFWHKLADSDFEVGVRVNDVDGIVRAEALPTKVILSAEIPADVLPQNLVKFLVKREAKRWLKPTG